MERWFVFVTDVLIAAVVAVLAIVVVLTCTVLIVCVKRSFTSLFVFHFQSVIRDVLTAIIVAFVVFSLSLVSLFK